MRDHAGQIAKAACLLLAALLLLQLVRAGLRMNPLSGVTIPALPTLAPDTNNTPTTSDPGPGRQAAAPRKEPGTNAAADKAPAERGTNRIAGEIPGNNPASNAPVVLTNPTPQAVDPGCTGLKTNPVPAVTNTATLTNPPAGTPENRKLPASATNLSAAAPGTTNPVVSDTNMATRKMTSPSSILSRGPMDGGRASGLPPEIKARVDRVYESELFGQIMRPQPMGLLGIAGNCAFLRAPGGQTGLVKEGDSLGEIKLLRIGINRVLVEQDGKKSELMIFEGLGGESLMPKENKETSK
jgi:hypothetical protein